MQISVSEAKAQLTELVHKAEAGEEIILTRHGVAAVRLVPVQAVQTPEARQAVLDAIRQAAQGKAAAGPSAARSQDFLYDGSGMPE